MPDYEGDDKYPAARRSRVEQAGSFGSLLLGIAGAVVTGAGALAHFVSENPEIVQAIASAAGVPLVVGPAILAGAGVVKYATKGR